MLYGFNLNVFEVQIKSPGLIYQVRILLANEQLASSYSWFRI